MLKETEIEIINESTLIEEALSLGLICKLEIYLNSNTYFLIPYESSSLPIEDSKVAFLTSNPNKDTDKLNLLENVISKLLENKESNKEKLIIFNKMLCELKLKLDNKK